MAITTNLSEFASDFNSANTGVILKTPGGITSVPEDYYTPYSYSNSAFSSANAGLILAQSAFNSANAEISLQSGINSTQNTHISAAFSKANSSITLGSTPLYLGSTNTSISGLTLTNPVIDGFTGNTGIINIGSGQIYKDVSGNVGIGTASTFYNAKLSVWGAINSGTDTSTGGSVILQGYYTSGATTNFGTEWASGGPSIGYCVIPSKSSMGSFLSSYPGSIDRYAINLGNGGIRFFVGDTQSPAIGSAATLSQAMTLTSKGLLVGYTSDSSLSGTGNAIFSGSVGIGTSSPDTSLYVASSGGSQKRAIHVASGTGAGAAGGIYIETNNASGGNGAVFEAIGKRSDGNGSAGFSGITALGHLRTDTAIAGAGQVLGSVWFGGNPSGTTTSDVRYSASIIGVSDTAWSSSSAMGTALAFYTGASGLDINATIANPGTERLRIDSSGNLGLGVTPSAWQVGGNLDGSNQFTWSSYDASIGSNYYYNSGAKYKASGLAASQYQPYGGAHKWFTAPSGTAGNPITFTQAMTLDASGSFYLNCTSNPLVSYGSARVHIDSGSIDGINLKASSSANAFNIQRPYGFTNPTMISFSVLGSGGASTQVGSITANTTNTTYTTTSDYRLKENVQPMQNALTTVSQLKPVTFDWKINGSKGQGFIAHELQAIVPDCVVGTKDAVDSNGNPLYQSVDASFLVATLTKAIQELNEKYESTIQELTQRIQQLESK